MKVEDIKEDTITLAVDLQGGLCDRLMLGSKGVINNANASIECWKFNAPDDEYIQELKEVKDLQNALQILSTDNFSLHVVNNLEQIKELLQDEKLELNLNNIEFKNNMYTIY